MTTPEYGYPVDGVPHRFSAVKEVVDKIISAPWFYDSEETRNDCYEMVFMLFRQGATDLEDLTRQSMKVAQNR